MSMIASVKTRSPFSPRNPFSSASWNARWPSRPVRLSWRAWWAIDSISRALSSEMAACATTPARLLLSAGVERSRSGRSTTLTVRMP